MGRLSGPVAFDVFSDDKGGYFGYRDKEIFMYQLWARTDNGHKIIGRAYKIAIDGVRQSFILTSVVSLTNCLCHSDLVVIPAIFLIDLHQHLGLVLSISATLFS